METKEKPKPTPDYLMQLMNDKKLMSSLPNFCGIFNHLERLLDEGESSSIYFIKRTNECVWKNCGYSQMYPKYVTVVSCCKQALKFVVKISFDILFLFIPVIRVFFLFVID